MKSKNCFEFEDLTVLVCGRLYRFERGNFKKE